MMSKDEAWKWISISITVLYVLFFTLTYMVLR